MKNKIIKTGKETIVVVDIPDHHVANITHIDPELDTLTVQDVRTGDYVFGINGRFKAFAHPSHLTEEDWKGIVDEEEESDIEDHRFAISYPDYCDLQRAFATATESGLSLLKANGVDDSWINAQIFVKV